MRDLNSCLAQAQQLRLNSPTIVGIEELLDIRHDELDAFLRAL